MMPNNTDALMGVTLLSDIARRLVDEDEPITNELLVAVRQSLENLANKGLMWLQLCTKAMISPIH